MKQLFFVLISIVLVACSTDLLAPCDDDGPVGELCREYRYFNGGAEGYVEFKLYGDSVAVSDFYNQNSRLVKTITERLEVAKPKLFPNNFRMKHLAFRRFITMPLIVFGRWFMAQTIVF